MSWHCSRALVEAFSEATCLAGDASAPSNTTPTPDQFYWPDKTTEHSRLSRFGMTSEPLTADRGADLLMWFREVFLARTSVSRGGEMGWTVSALGSGRKWLGSLAKYDPDSRSWRTRQLSLEGGFAEFSETWPRWGSMRNGELFLRESWVPGTCGSASGSWLPTVGKNEFRGCSKPRFRGSPQYRGAKMSEGLRTCANDPTYLHPSFGEHAMGWPLTWTELAPLGTDKFQLWRRQHGMSSPAEKEAQ